MDAWIVVAAASAVYLSKQWQKILRNGEDSASTMHLPHKKSCPLRGLAWGKKVDEVSAESENNSRVEVSEMTQLDGALAADMASAGRVDGEKVLNLGNHKEGNVLLVSSLGTGFSRNGNLQENEDGIRMTGNSDNASDYVPEPSTGYMGPFLGLSRKRRALRTKRLHSHSNGPISSLESCLLAQLYNEHAEMEECLLRSLQSPPAPNGSSLCTSNGSRVINKETGDSPCMQIRSGDDNLQKEAYFGCEETANGVPSLPKLRYTDLPRKMKLKTGRGQRQKLGSSIKMVNRKHFHPQGGTILIFFMKFLFHLCIFLFLCARMYG